MANLPYTAFTGTNAVDTAPFNSMMESLISDNLPSRTGPSFGPPSASASSTDSASTVDSNTSSTAPASAPTPSTFVTSVSGSRSSNIDTSIAPSSSSHNGASGTASSPTNTAGSSSVSATTSESCSGISCSSGLKAAVAVPVVVGVLAIIALFFFLARRRRKNKRHSAVLQEKPKKKWTRHLRIFSFDAELLMGGRFSSSNSMHSGAAGSTHRGENPSIHSIDDAPPYRDAVSHAQHPNMSQAGAGVAAGAVAGGAIAASNIPRSESRASAPPPYSQTENRPPTNPESPVVASSNPFSDSNPVSPVDGASPFRDPSEDGRSTRSRPTVSRNSSIRTGLNPEEPSVIGGSDAGSIREAQIGRHVSVASGGRTITNIRNSSQSPPGHTPPATD